MKVGFVLGLERKGRLRKFYLYVLFPLVSTNL